MTPSASARDSLCALNLSATGLAVGGGMALVVCSNISQARQLQADLEFLCGPDSSRCFPDWETLPYDRMAVAGHLIGQRLEVLDGLLQGWRGLLLVTPASLLQRLPPVSWLAGNALSIRCDDSLPPETLLDRLTAAGYARVDNVEASSQVAIRGAVLDFFPAGQKQPLRVEFDDDRVASMRWFDPVTQLGTGLCRRVEFFPGREFSLDASGIATFRERFRRHFDLDENHCRLFTDISSGRAVDGAEYYLDLMFEKTALLTDYLPDDGKIPTVLLKDAKRALKRLAGLTEERHQLLRGDPDFPLLCPDRIFADMAQMPLEPVELEKIPGARSWTPFRGAPTPDRLNRWIARNSDAKLLLCAGSEGALAEGCSGLNLEHFPASKPPPRCSGWQNFVAGETSCASALAPLTGAYRFAGSKGRDILLLGFQTGQSDGQDKKLPEQSGTSDPDGTESLLADLRPGQLVVHRVHGIGRYRGLQRIALDGRELEFATLEYRDSALLHLPIGELHLLTGYGNAPGTKAMLDRLGSEQFQKARHKALQKARDDAAELLTLYARRNAGGVVRLKVDEAEFDAFCRQFPFRQTPDQKQITERIRRKLGGDDARPLVICGDVGFGKTELAMRAAFVATKSGRQCCLLAPTTLLCRQHYERFRERFAGWNIAVEKLDSSLRETEKRKLKERLSDGETMILICTHALLRGRWQVPNLGLAVIDEEHRFGVDDKEKIHGLKIGAQAISMTATPIPRTLHRSLSSLNELVMMHEPPPGRIPVQTFVREWCDDLVREALRRERLRGGQTFVVHDRISGMDELAERIAELVPDIRLATAHGRMSPAHLQRIMREYNDRTIDVLLSTTIIESGIDIPNANTLLVTRADRMGLAQLHQLRGRVGRTDRQAWCWLLYPEGGGLSADSLERLQAVENANSPGAGFILAQQDMEQRGAGELLGKEQSGHVQRVGLDLYLRMVEEAAEDIRSGRGIDLHPQQHGCEVDLSDTALLPSEWIPDPWTRARYYHRLASTGCSESVLALEEELRDRFGPLPEAAHCLLRNTRLRIAAQKLGASRLSVSGRECVLEIRNGAIDPEAIIALVKAHAEHIRLTPGSLRMRMLEAGAGATADWILKRLARVQKTDAELV